MNRHEVEVKNVEPILLAVVRERATPATLTRQILGSPVWTWLRSRGIKSGGHNVVVYFSGVGPDFGVEIGADVTAPFEGGDGVFCSATPAGRAATTRHVGPYAKMGGAHASLREWFADNRQTFSGVSYEFYGHWTEDETRLTTDIFYLLQE